MNQLVIEDQPLLAASWDRYIRLTEHPTARNQAIAKSNIRPGETILVNSALAAVLLPEQKGQRCDACFRRPLSLKRCSGCAEYWYCGKDCQGQHWKTAHKFMCKHIAKFRTSLDFQSSPAHRQTDAFLLSELVAEHGNRLTDVADLPSENLDDPLATFASLLPLPTELQQETAFICPTSFSNRISPTVIASLFSRFSNNNFIIHSHLTPIGHGIFPLASRLFNHSCVPNAVIAYIFTDGRIQMAVKALSNIGAGDEITIPYFDPALPYQRRQGICRYSYGFECVCPNCSFCKSLQVSTQPPESSRCVEIGEVLVKHAFPDLHLAWPSQPTLLNLPVELHVVLHEDFLPELSKTFVDAAHDGPYSLALRSGLALLALYVTIYPPRFPQTGLHCLEMAKTAWNASVQDESLDDIGREELMQSARQFLSLARDSLSVLGKEGDEEDGPLLECAALGRLLNLE